MESITLNNFFKRRCLNFETAPFCDFIKIKVYFFARRYMTVFYFCL